ncbi:hypothetical protein EVJ58_g10446 [Rhodofomes roseus]|uniref:F-box domain-containing protein n=1 Tax=Rhodofomes roseus TaxID=34475 RepID=A0A4Y9XNI6_9APHY|nr:hypothetical protein EVJ58_g10446 [Rhodofomes roseus]
MRLKAKWATRLKNVVTGLRFYVTRNHTLKGSHGERCLDRMAEIDTTVTDEDVLPEGDEQIHGTAESDAETSDEPEYDRIPFRPPTYTMYEHKLMELICKFNRDYPLVLARCMHLNQYPLLDEVDLARRILELLPPPQSNIHPRLASESIADNAPIVDPVIVAASGSCTFSPDSCPNGKRELASNALKQQTLIKRKCKRSITAAAMDDPVDKIERIEEEIADAESIPDKLTGEDSGKEEKDSGSASEWRPDTEILFRQPIYLSDTGPRFPQELIERICEFLWDEPVQLAVSCTRICPAWYHAARRLLPAHNITWRTREALQDYAHTLTSHRNAPYRKRFQQLWIYDNASKPFAHVWPIFIPGWILPELDFVHLVDLDWSTKTPHDSFFVYLSSYTSISSLQMYDCRFRSLLDLRRHPLRPGSVPDHIALRARSHRLKSIDLCGSGHGGPEYPDVSSDYQGTTAQALLHMVAANSSTVTRLDLDLRFFTSASALWQWLAPFGRLTSFTAQYQFASGPMITLEETVPARTENTYIHSWEIFALMDVPDRSALQLLQLLVTPIWYSKLHYFHVEATPSLAGNTSLQRVYISLRDVAPSPQKIHSALTAVLSDIVSVDLQHVSIWFTLAHLEPEVLSQNHRRTPVAPDPAESVSAFHTILSREIFNAYDKFVEVVFCVDNIQDNPALVATIKAYMINLFTPWLDRGIVELRFASADGYYERITCVPASMPSEDKSDDRGGEDVEENESVRTEQ